MISAATLAGLGTASWAGLKAWKEWLELRRFELTHTGEHQMPATGGRIEIADLRERVRKLEAIAAGIDY
jgi:hypothetical protein